MKFVGTILAVLIAAVILFRSAYPSVTFRYRLTVEAEIGGQPRRGSGVIQVSYRSNLRVFGASASLVTEVDGEAVTVDLGERDAVVVLLTHGKNIRSGPEDILPNIFGVVSGGFGSEDFSRLREISGRREIPLDFLPLTIWLPNTDDPKSAELIDPSSSESSSRVPRIKMADIEIVSHGVWPLSAMGVTGVPITRGIQRKLPWLVGFRGYLGGQPEPIWSQPEKNLTGADFIKGASS